MTDRRRVHLCFHCLFRCRLPTNRRAGFSWHVRKLSFYRRTDDRLTDAVKRAENALVLTGNGHAQGDGYGLRALDEAPGAREVPRPDPLVRVHLQRVVVPAAEHAVHPREHDVALPVAADRGQRQYGHAAHEHGRLAQVLARDPALHRVPDHDQPERHAPHRPRQAHVHLQRQRRLAEAVFLRLVRLRRKTSLAFLLRARRLPAGPELRYVLFFLFSFP